MDLPNLILMGRQCYLPKTCRNLIIDETCPVMDGCKRNRGCRPEDTYSSLNLPKLVKATIKIYVANSMIAGSAANGDQCHCASNVLIRIYPTCGY